MDLKDAVAAIATLLAAYFGARLAFNLERTQKREEEKSRNIEAANRALFVLLQFWNHLDQFRRETVEPHRECADAWLNMAARPHRRVTFPRLPADELAFLLQSQHADVYARVLLEEHRFFDAISLIEARSEILLSRAFPALAAAGVPIGAQREQREVEAIVGIDAVHKLKIMTSSVVKNVDEDLASLMSAFRDLRAAVKGIYPSVPLLDVELKKSPPPDGASPNSVAGPPK